MGYIRQKSVFNIDFIMFVNPEQDMVFRETKYKVRIRL